MKRGSLLNRQIDRYAGIMLVGMLSFFKRRKALPSSIRKIGVMRTVAIGDAILLTGILRDLKAGFPTADIFFICGETNSSIGPLLDHEIKIVAVALGKPWEAISKLRSLNLDVLIDGAAWSRIDAIFCLLSKAKYTIGFRKDGQYRHYGYDRAVFHQKDRHESENYGALLSTLGIPVGCLPAIDVGPSVNHNSVPLAIFHPWAGGFRSDSREWPENRWVELAVALQATGLRIGVTSAPGENARAERLVSLMQGAGADAVQMESCDLSGVASYLSAAAVVVSVNTGMMHLASCLGTPTVALNGPTSARRWGPVGRRSISVDSSCENCGFLDLGFEYDGQRSDCMEFIAVREVLDAIEAVRSVSQHEKS